MYYTTLPEGAYCLFKDIPRSQFKRIHRHEKDLPFLFLFKVWRTEYNHKHYSIYIDGHWNNGRFYAFTWNEHYLHGFHDITNIIPKLKQYLEDCD